MKAAMGVDTFGQVRRNRVLFAMVRALIEQSWEIGLREPATQASWG